MAQQWYFRAHDQEFGPITFRELVELVRAGVVDEGDPVRSSWRTEWQSAVTVVGLFHMAGRPAEELARLYAAARPIPAPVVEPQMEAADHQPTARPDWLVRLLESAGRAKPSGSDGISILGSAASGAKVAMEGAAAPDASSASILGEAGTASVTGASANRCSVDSLPPELAAYWSQPEEKDAWSEAIRSAVTAVDDRRVKRSGWRWIRFRRVFSWLGPCLPGGERRTAVLRIGLRVVPAIVCANLVALAVENWSFQEALRFPRRDASARHSTVRWFPLVGECGSGEYMFLMVDAMLVGGATAYFAARWLESNAEG